MKATVASSLGRSAGIETDGEGRTSRDQSPVAIPPRVSRRYSDGSVIPPQNVDNDVGEFNKQKLLQYYVRYVDGQQNADRITAEVEQTRTVAPKPRRLSATNMARVHGAPIKTGSGSYRAARSNRNYSEPPLTIDSIARKAAIATEGSSLPPIPDEESEP